MILSTSILENVEINYDLFTFWFCLGEHYLETCKSATLFFNVLF